MYAANEDQDAKRPGDVKAIIDEVLTSGKADGASIIAALENAGCSVRGPSTDAPTEGDGQEPVGLRAERNPPEGTSDGDEALGEPMSLEQIGAELFDEQMNKSSAPAS